MDRESFVFYRSFYEAISQLGDDSQLKLYQAIFGYQFEGIEPKLEGVEFAMRKLIQPQLDANNKRYEDGKKGGAPKGNSNARKTTKTTTGGFKKTTKNNQKQPNVNVNVNVNDNVNENVNENENHLTDEFDEALNEFKKMRKQIKKPITEKGVELIKKKLNEMYPNDTNLQIKCLYKSIENSWQGVFALSEQDIKGYSPPGKKKIAQVDPNKVLSLNEL